MSISKSDISTRIDDLKLWQKNNEEKIHSDPHLEGYNAAINTEILFLEELLNPEKPVKQAVVKEKTVKATKELP